MKSHIVIIRFHYKEDDPRFCWRLAYFKAMVLPRLLNQSHPNFTIGIRCNPCHEEIFKKLSDKIITFQTKDDSARYKIGNNNKKYFEDFVKWDDVIGLEKFDIQSGLDSDDLIGKDYIKIINESFDKETKKTHLCFQPQLFNAMTLQTKPMMQYHSKRGSAFMALYQPNKEDYHFIYEISHISLWKLANKSIIIPAGHCWATAHLLNESTGK